MKLLFNPTLGVAGDMFIASLIDLGADPAVVLNAMQTSCETLDPAEITLVPIEKEGKKGLQIVVETKSKKERTGTEMREALEQAIDLLKPENPDFPRVCLERLLVAEQEFHQTEEPHLHEMGSGDTIADFMGATIALEQLGAFNAELYALPVTTGFGELAFSHGKFEIPPPATRIILRDWSQFVNQEVSTPGSIAGELTTPTGATILSSLNPQFVSLIDEKIKAKGLGFGTKVYSISTYFKVTQYD